MGVDYSADYRVIVLDVVGCGHGGPSLGGEDLLPQNGVIQ